MAHPSLHAAAGMAIGMAIGGVRCWQTRRCKRSLAHRMGAWLLWSWAGAFFALIPGLLRLLGWPQSWAEGWWMNIFVGYPLLNQTVRHGGALIGGALLGLCLTLQYLLVLAALFGTRRRRRALTTAAGCIR